MLPIKRKHLHFSTNLLTLLIISCNCHEFKFSLLNSSNQINHNDYDEHYLLNNQTNLKQTNQMISNQTNNNNNNNRQEGKYVDDILFFVDLNRTAPISAPRSDHHQNHHQQLDGDLLAVESTRILSIGKPPAQASIVPPYASQAFNSTTTTSTAAQQNSSSDTQPFQLLKLYRAPPAPIFIRHQIQPATHGHFYRPESTSDQLLDGHRDLPRQQHNNSVFALLPSWPSVYVAQRPATTHHETSPSSLLPPRPQLQATTDTQPPANASQLPNWTRNGNLERSEDDRTQQPIKLLRNSSVEYEQENEKQEQEQHQQNLSTDGGVKQQHVDSKANWTLLLKQAAENNLMESLMVTNKTMVSLFCDPNEMLIRFKFKRPFYGLIETNLDSINTCRLSGNGSQYYELHVALNGCGTRQEMPRVYINSLNIQFLENNRNRLSDESIELLDSNEPHELKTIICSYPSRLKAIQKQQQQPDRTNIEPFDEQIDNNEVAFGNKSERIVEGQPNDSGGLRNDDQEAARRLVFYDPLVLVAAVLLLAFMLVALTTGAYLVRKNRQQYRRHHHLAGLGSSSASGLSSSSSSARIYRASPAQLANQRPLVAPPLITVGKSAHQTHETPQQVHLEQSRRHKNISMRPAGRRYADEKIKTSSSSSSSSPSSSPKRRRLIAPISPSSSTYKRQLEQEKSKQSSRVNKQSEKQQQQMKKQGDDSLDSGGQSSVTTIEIPFVGASEPKSGRESLPVATGGEVKHSRRVQQEETRTKEQKFNTISGQTKTAATPTERIIKTTTLEAPKRTSPLPFGSFRSKLTSPVEFRRLENISRVFSNVTGGQSLRWSKYHSKIMRTFSEKERSELSRLIQSDEVFRSNVVDSTDRQTFRRKLRNNVKYSKMFRPTTWDLIEEIFLDGQMSQMITDEREKFEARMALRQATSGRPVEVAKEAKEEEATRNEHHQDELRRSRNYKETDLTLLSSSDSLNEPQVARVHESRSEQSREPSGVPIVRVSQFNSTRSSRDGATLINIDSVTNFSSTGSFASYTRSRLEQRTSYLEETKLHDSSVPFVDESRDCLSSSSSSSSSSTSTSSSSSLNRTFNRRRKRQ